MHHPYGQARSARVLAILGLLVAVAFPMSSAMHSAAAPLDSITLTSPRNITIAESDDYATQVLGDPWDMNNLTDVDHPYQYNVPSVSNGIWSDTTQSSVNFNNGSFFLLQYQNFDQVYSYLGEKDGVNYPIDTTRYTHLLMRVNVGAVGQRRSVIYYFAQPHSTSPSCGSKQFDVTPGWHIYDVDLTTNDAGNQNCWHGLGTDAGLRVDLNPDVPNNLVQIDWARLTPGTGQPVNITWDYTGSGTSTVNLYLSTSPDGSQDNEMLIGSAQASSRSFTWNKGGMAPGTYYIHAVLNGATSSSGALNVNTAPLLKIDAPSNVSGEDYAEAVLGTSWEGSNSSQFQELSGVTNVTFTPGYMQASATNNDPSVLWTVNDTHHPIDTSRYRYMSIRFYLQAPSGRPWSPYNAGPRIVYARDNQFNFQVTQAALSPYDTWIPLSFDLANTPLVTGSQGWNGPETTLRFDPHEEDDRGQPPLLPDFFRIDRSHLTSMPIAGKGTLSRSGTLIRWTPLQGSGSVDLYRDNNNQGYDGTVIARDIPLSAGAYSWDTTNMPDGTYWIYAVEHDAYNSAKQYSLVPLQVSQASPSTIFTDVPTNYWAVNDINDLGLRQIINGYNQSDGTVMFRPGNTATRAQLSKMVVLGAGWPLVNPQNNTFADVLPSNQLYTFVETAARYGVIGGYACGGPGEPCDAQRRAYFRPNNNVTRAQTAKMIVISRGWAVCTTCAQTFADVLPGNALLPYVQTAFEHGILGGYPCGGPGEPCDSANRPYYRPGLSVTRAQLSKMLSRALTTR